MEENKTREIKPKKILIRNRKDRHHFESVLLKMPRKKNPVSNDINNGKQRQDDKAI